MVEAITAWCERLKAEHKGLHLVASDIEYLCRSYTEAKHANFWEFGLPRLIELLIDRFRQEESAMNLKQSDTQFEAHRSEHRRILADLKAFADKYDRGLLLGEPLRNAERDILFYLDDELAEHFFSGDDSVREHCLGLGLAFP